MDKNYLWNVLLKCLRLCIWCSVSMVMNTVMHKVKAGYVIIICQTKIIISIMIIIQHWHKLWHISCTVIKYDNCSANYTWTWFWSTESKLWHPLLIGHIIRITETLFTLWQLLSRIYITRKILFIVVIWNYVFTTNMTQTQCIICILYIYFYTHFILMYTYIFVYISYNLNIWWIHLYLTYILYIYLNIL